MPSVKAANPRDLFASADWARLTAVSRWKGVALVAHAWCVVALACAAPALAWQWHWLAGLALLPVAIAVVGGRQLGLAILMHDAAHGLLHPRRKTNNFLGQWPTGAPVGTDLHAYRAYHLTHHRYTQQPEDPDLPLSAPFPTSAASLKRKVLRDLSGQTFFKQRSHQFLAAWKGLKAMLRGPASERQGRRDTSAGRAFNQSGGSDGTAAEANGIDAPEFNEEGARSTAKTVGRLLLTNAALLAISLVTLGLLPYLVWLMALATTFQLFLRIRNIAEHACTTTGSDDPFSHARTTYAGFAERASVAPYWVNFHSEHHLFMAVPCYNLPLAHQMLGTSGHHSRMTISPHYRDVLRQVAAG